MIHGQCLDVGVGGYLLHGGVNVMGSSDKYGLGSHHVIDYTVVTATGNVIKVNDDNVTNVDTQQEARQTINAHLISENST